MNQERYLEPFFQIKQYNILKTFSPILNNYFPRPGQKSALSPILLILEISLQSFEILLRNP